VCCAPTSQFPQLRALDNLFVIAFQLALIIVIVVTGVIIRNYFHKKAPYYVSTSLLSSLFRRVFILTIISVFCLVRANYMFGWCDMFRFHKWFSWVTKRTAISSA